MHHYFVLISSFLKSEISKQEFKKKTKKQIWEPLLLLVLLLLLPFSLFFLILLLPSTSHCDSIVAISGPMVHHSASFGVDRVL
ncbi:hypothetical protein SLEP1_g48813 [Rubroshorea leprosula]|uniref:Uncharacterized protein n=1 Tax=Rubroshorea leprosula TaxID=152421 RepID=A0AAV5LVN5_9ROSI|nr:hypothetical protein SLEP1_g48813 [Rubroshorea leprosula]